jgi:hypothetical protein
MMARRITEIAAMHVNRMSAMFSRTIPGVFEDVAKRLERTLQGVIR